MTSKLRCVIALVALLGAAAVAHGQELGGLYLGGSAGRAQLGYDNTRYANQQSTIAAPFGKLDWTSESLHKRADAWWINAGYLRWRYVAVEASYLHLGELTYRTAGTFTPTGAKAEKVEATTSVLSRGPALALLLRVPVAESLDLNLRVGDYYARTTLENGLQVTQYNVTRTSASGSSLLLGAGASYLFGGHWSARLDYLHVSGAGDSAITGKYSVGALTAGASYAF